MISQEKIGSLPTRSWYERLNFLNILLIIFLFLAIFSGKNLVDQNRSADVISGVKYFIKKFFPPDFSNFHLILQSLSETFQMAIVSTFKPITVPSFFRAIEKFVT